MKRFFTIIAIAFVATIAAGNTARAQVQGEMGAGLNFVIGTGDDYTNYGMGIKYQWTFIDNMRLEPSFTYFFKKDMISSWDLTANVHYMFDIMPMLQAYPIAGVGMTNYHRDYDILGLQKKQDNTKFAFNFGAGMELMFSPTIGMNLEYNFRVVENWNRSHIALGMVYKF